MVDRTRLSEKPGPDRRGCHDGDAMTDTTESRLVLASTSRYRRALLERLGVGFTVAAPAVDEDAYRHLPPEEMARELARLKAEAVSAPGRLVIGSDQVAELDGHVLNKPGTADRAAAQLELLAGRTHRLITAVAVHDEARGQTHVDVDVHRLTMRPLSRALIDAYVRHDQPLDCGGSYRLEGRGIALFSEIQADPSFADDTAIVGLPLGKLCAMLLRCGFDVLAPTGS